MLDLYTLQIDEEKLHPNFKHLLKDKAATRSVIKDWTKGFIDRDGKIIKEFQSTFNSSFWEFYLHAAFTELGFSFDYSVDRPDFLLAKEGIELVAEAVIANNPNEGQPEWERESKPHFSKKLMHEVIELAMIRILTAIDGKHKKVLNNYGKLPHVKGRPFILCLAPFEQPYFFAQGDQAIRKVLYKFDAPLYQRNEETGEVRIVGETAVNEVVKHNGIELPLGLFTDDRMKEISAIIFSSTATMTKVKALNSKEHPFTIFSAVRYQKEAWDTPYFISKYGGGYDETLLDGLHIYLNPFAEVPFDPNLFYSPEISLHQYDPETEITYEQVENGFLISHSCMTLNPVDVVPEKIEQDSSKEYKSFVSEWNDSELRAVNANVGPGINNHMAHIDGWTVTVFMDAIDSDWSAIAKPDIYYSLQEFILIRNDSTIGPIDFYETMEEAFENIKKEIAAASISQKTGEV